MEAPHGILTQEAVKGTLNAPFDVHSRFLSPQQSSFEKLFEISGTLVSNIPRIRLWESFLAGILAEKGIEAIQERG